MKTKKCRLQLLTALMLTAIAWLSFKPAQQVIHIYLAGDSTMADKAKSARPEMGWGTRMTDFFDSTVVVVNKAQNGRSTKSFMAEGKWKEIINVASAGDYVLIQFGHNDEVITKAAYTTEKDFQQNLLQMVKEVRNKKALPVLITPAARRKFDSLGHVVDTHLVYAELVRKVAKRNQVVLIDLAKDSQELLATFGEEESKLLFNHLKPGQNPNYPDGKTDDTHFNEFGARKMAQLVLKALRKSYADLDQRVVKSSWTK